MTDTRRGPAVEPREIVQEGERALRVTWGDGRECRYGAAELRRACPCAQCVNEWTGEKVLDPATVSEEITIDGVEVVGRYALNFRFGDRHQHGIYSFRLLRELCEEAP
jgi:DUF971 family protein